MFTVTTTPLTFIHVHFDALRSFMFTLTLYVHSCSLWLQHHGVYSCSAWQQHCSHSFMFILTVTPLRSFMFTLTTTPLTFIPVHHDNNTVNSHPCSPWQQHRYVFVCLFCWWIDGLLFNYWTEYYNTVYEQHVIMIQFEIHPGLFSI